MLRPSPKRLETSTVSPFVAPDGLRFERATRSWQPFVGAPRATRRRRFLGDLIFVVWAGTLIGAMLDAFLSTRF